MVQYVEKPCLLMATKISSFSGTFMTLVSTGVVQAATEDMKIQTDFAWKFGLWYALFSFVVPWLIYLRYRNSGLLLPRQISMVIGGGVGAFSMFSFVGYFFYFGFAPIPIWAHILGMGGGLGVFGYWGYLVWGDVMTALQKHNLFATIYVEKDDAILYYRNKKAFSDRSPFKSIHLYAAMLVAPFTFVLNRVLTPYTGSGHGVFIVLAFFGVPMTMFMIGSAVQVYILTIYYPIKLQRQTGKPVIDMESC